METTLFESMGIDPSYIIIALAVLLLICIVLIIVLFAKCNNVSNKLTTFTSGKDGATLESQILTRFKEIDNLKSTDRKRAKEFRKLQKDINLCISKTALLKYDAFNDMGGNLSFALALLTEDNDGIVLNCMHAREGSFTYAKEIIKGESYIVLSEEEKEVLQQAIDSKDALAGIMSMTSEED